MYDLKTKIKWAILKCILNVNLYSNMINDTKINISKNVEAILSKLTKQQIRFYTNIIIELKSKNEPFDEKELYDIFDKIDTEGKSSIQFSHIINFLCVLRSDINAFFIDQILYEFLQEKREEISRDDFVVKMKIGKKTREKGDFSELEEIFYLLDTDHDGYLGIQDLQTVMGSLGEIGFDENACKTLIKIIINKQDDLSDKTSDGISKETFIEIFRNEYN